MKISEEMYEELERILEDVRLWDDDIDESYRLMDRMGIDEEIPTWMIERVIDVLIDKLGECEESIERCKYFKSWEDVSSIGYEIYSIADMIQYLTSNI